MEIETGMMEITVDMTEEKVDADEKVGIDSVNLLDFVGYEIGNGNLVFEVPAADSAEFRRRPRSSAEASQFVNVATPVGNVEIPNCGSESSRFVQMSNYSQAFTQFQPITNNLESSSSAQIIESFGEAVDMIDGESISGEMIVVSASDEMVVDSSSYSEVVSVSMSDSKRSPPTDNKLQIVPPVFDVELTSQPAIPGSASDSPSSKLKTSSSLPSLDLVKSITQSKPSFIPSTNAAQTLDLVMNSPSSSNVKLPLSNASRPSSTIIGKSLKESGVKPVSHQDDEEGESTTETLDTISNSRFVTTYAGKTVVSTTLAASDSGISLGSSIDSLDAKPTSVPSATLVDSNSAASSNDSSIFTHSACLVPSSHSGTRLATQSDSKILSDDSDEELDIAIIRKMAAEMSNDVDEEEDDDEEADDARTNALPSSPGCLVAPSGLSSMSRPLFSRPRAFQLTRSFNEGILSCTSRVTGNDSPLDSKFLPRSSTATRSTVPQKNLSSSCFAQLRMDKGPPEDEELTSLNWLTGPNVLAGLGSPIKMVDGEGKISDNKDADNDQMEEGTDTDKTARPSIKHPPGTFPHPPHIPYNPVIHVNSKPPYSFSSLIFMAVESTTTKRLAVKDIYAWILEHFPFFRHAPTGWKNSVRHNLSLNKCFRKTDKDGTSGGKGSYWCVDPAHRSVLLRALGKVPYYSFNHLASLNLRGPPPPVAYGEVYLEPPWEQPEYEGVRNDFLEVPSLGEVSEVIEVDSEEEENESNEKLANYTSDKADSLNESIHVECSKDSLDPTTTDDSMDKPSGDCKPVAKEIKKEEFATNKPNKPSPYLFPYLSKRLEEKALEESMEGLEDSEIDAAKVLTMFRASSTAPVFPFGTDAQIPGKKRRGRKPKSFVSTPQEKPPKRKWTRRKKTPVPIKHPSEDHCYSATTVLPEDLQSRAEVSRSNETIENDVKNAKDVNANSKGHRALSPLPTSSDSLPPLLAQALCLAAKPSSPPAPTSLPVPSFLKEVSGVVRRKRGRKPKKRLDPDVTTPPRSHEDSPKKTTPERRKSRDIATSKTLMDGVGSAGVDLKDPISVKTLPTVRLNFPHRHNTRYNTTMMNSRPPTAQSFPAKPKNKRKSSNPSNVKQMASRYYLRTKEELEEEQKAIADGANALLSLAGINNNSLTEEIPLKVKQESCDEKVEFLT